MLTCVCVADGLQFCKKNMSSANPVHRELSPKMSAAFHSATPSGCKLLTKASLPLEVQTEAGAPTEVVVEVTVDGSSFEWTVVQVDKRPTRLAESTFFSFAPAVEPAGWTVQVLGSEMDPTDTLGKVGESYVDSVYGGSPHLRGVEASPNAQLFVVWKLSETRRWGHRRRAGRAQPGRSR